MMVVVRRQRDLVSVDDRMQYRTRSGEICYYRKTDLLASMLKERQQLAPGGQSTRSPGAAAALQGRESFEYPGKQATVVEAAKCSDQRCEGGGHVAPLQPYSHAGVAAAGRMKSVMFLPLD